MRISAEFSFIKTLIIIGAASILFSSCLRTYYPTAYQTSAPPMVFEHSNEIDSSSTRYISADVTLSKGSSDNEKLQLLKLNYFTVDTRDHTNFNLGLYGYTGNYRVSGLSVAYDGNKNVFGMGGDVNFNLNFKIKKFKTGIGLNAGVGVEFGGYYNFRKSAGEASVITNENDLFFYMLSVFYVISYDISESINISSQINVGIPGLISPSILLNNNGYVYWLSWLPDRDISKNYYGQRIVVGFMMDINKLKIIL